jgi:hypothetical protein
MTTAKTTLYAAGLWIAEDPRRVSIAAAALTTLAGLIAFLAGWTPAPVLVAPAGGGGEGGMG